MGNNLNIVSHNHPITGGKMINQTKTQIRETLEKWIRSPAPWKWIRTASSADADGSGNWRRRGRVISIVLFAYLH